MSKVISNSNSKDHSLKNLFIVTSIFIIIGQLPVVIYRYLALEVNTYDLAIEIILMYITTMSLFALVMLNKYISMILTPILFTISAIHSYYVIFFRQVLTTSIIADISSVNLGFILEYVNITLCLITLGSFIVGYLLSRLTINKHKIKILIIVLVTCSILSLLKDHIRPMRNYTPFNIFKSVFDYFKGYQKYLKYRKEQTNVTNKFKFSFTQKDKDPLLVVLVIGESMRGDHLGMNGYRRNTTPLLSKQKNLVSFRAKSSGVSTRESIPYMLSRYTPPNFDQAIRETGITSIFKKLGFNTSWIGNQGAFGKFELTFTSNITESDTWLIANDVQKNSTNTDDINLLPYMKELLSKASEKNNFMILHLLGSHWNTNQRYPESFQAFNPICKSSTPTPGGCKAEEIINSYDNSILYTDFVLNEIIKEIQNKNAILIYSSDHGTLLGENGRFGHGHNDKKVQDIVKDVGFFIYLSDKFIANNPNYLNNIINKKGKMISHDYIFHSLLDCADIESGIIDKKLSLCSK